jgi:choline dehydrogenase
VYLRPVLHRPNLSLEVGSLVTRLLIERGRCTGVSYLRHGAPVQARASGEVIVCAGAVGSPQLLMLSGIGPADALRALGIDPVADIPGVGANLQDHPVTMACCQAASPLPPSRYNHQETCAALRSALAGGWPDLLLFPVLLPAGPGGYRLPPGGFALAAAAVAPDSRGTVRLAAADPLAAPLIDPGLLRDGRDLDRLEAGLAIIRHAASGTAFKQVNITETWPGLVTRTSSTLRFYIRRTVGSCHHPAGTCRIGPGTDPAAVTDPQLRVRGISGLRVADASVIPLIPLGDLPLMSPQCGAY